jgi:branched-chain amino acid aminotransferase
LAENAKENQRFLYKLPKAVLRQIKVAHIYPYAFFGDKVIDFDEANLSIASSAVLYGLSVYTVFPVNLVGKERRAFRLQDHYRRLCDSARIIGIDTFENNWSFEKIVEAIRPLVHKNAPTKDVFARATVHVNELVAGTRSRGLKTTLSIFLYDAQPILPSTGARLKTSMWRRIPDYSIPSRAKVNGAYVNSVLAKQDALDSGYDDCIFLDAQGHVCELSAANIFLVRDGMLHTPNTTSDLLEGINRRSIIELAKHEGLNANERTIDLTELYIADEVFACGTSAFVAPILEIDGRKIGSGEIGPITKKLQDHHTDITRGGHKQFEKWVTSL